MIPGLDWQNNNGRRAQLRHPAELLDFIVAITDTRFRPELNDYFCIAQMRRVHPFTAHAGVPARSTAIRHRESRSRRTAARRRSQPQRNFHRAGFFVGGRNAS
jgi:hypothetical protein